MNLRATIFWGRDLFSGGRTRKELREVEFLNSGAPAAAERRLAILREHLKYVKTLVPYYREFARGHSLRDFPVLTKEDIRANQSRMIADGCDQSKMHVASTSGSTGTPFRVYQDSGKRRRATAESIYFGRKAGYQIGTPLWYLKLWTQRSSMSRASYFARNIRPVDVSFFREDDAQTLLRTVRKQAESSAIISYSSSLETIARVLARHDQHIQNGKISAIIGQSEPFSQEAREILSRSMGVCPVGRYGMEEVGILAQQDSLDETYHMNLASHVVEVLQLDSDARAPLGQTGRVVVTDLVNKAQPMIRYETGDIAVAGSLESETGFVETLSRLEGRGRDRIYDADDRPLSPMISYNFWWKYPSILQYQIVQRARGYYLLRLEVEDGFDQEFDLIQDFREQVGSQATINIEYNDASYWPTSGKRQVIVAEYTPPIVQQSDD